MTNTDLTPEQEKILAQARQDAEAEVAEAEVAEFDAATTTDQEIADELVRHEALTETQEAPAPVTPTRQGVTEWGPYDKLTNVSTPYGTFGVPAGEVLYFTQEERFSRREGRMITANVPTYMSAEQAFQRV